MQLSQSQSTDKADKAGSNLHSRQQPSRPTQAQPHAQVQRRAELSKVAKRLTSREGMRALASSALSG